LQEGEGGGYETLFNVEPNKGPHVTLEGSENAEQ